MRVQENQAVKKYFGHVDLTLEHIISRNGRTIKEGDGVKVYRNFNKDCLSIVKGKFVCGYAEYVELADVTFTVDKKRQYVCGKILYGDIKRSANDIQAIYDLIESQGYKRVIYNHEYDSFVRVDTDEKIEKAKFGIIVMDRIYILD